MPWLERHGSTPEDARRNAGSLKTQLNLAQQDARRHLDEEIRTSPVLPEAEEELRRSTLAAFRGSDITGALFAWAGKLAPGTSPLAIQQVTLTCPRSTFTAIGYIDGVMGSHARRLGYYLAASSLNQLTDLARQNANERDVRREDLAAAVRDTIAEVSGTPAGEASIAPAARTAVLIPDSWALKVDLAIAATTHADRLEAARSDVIRNLDLQDKGLASRIVGAIDGAPVVEVTVNAPGQDNWVLVIDLTRFGELRRGTTDGTFPAEPTLELVQPDDPLRPSAGTAAPNASPALGQQPGLLEVQVILSLATDIETNDRSAVRVIRVGAPPQTPHAAGATRSLESSSRSMSFSNSLVRVVLLATTGRTRAIQVKRSGTSNPPTHPPSGPRFLSPQCHTRHPPWHGAHLHRLRLTARWPSPATPHRR